MPREASLATLGLEVDSSGAIRGLEGFTGKARTAGAAAFQLSSGIGALGLTFKIVTGLIISFGVAIGGITLLSFAQQALAFSRAMGEVGTLLPPATDAMRLFGETVRQISLEFGSSTIENAQALYSIISAGATDAADAVYVLNEANRLARAGVTSVAVAADGLTSLLNAYGLSASGAAVVSNSLFIAMRGGKTTVEELSRSLGAVAPIAANLGVSLLELTSVVSALTIGGLETSRAVTGLQGVFTGILRPTTEAQEQMKLLSEEAGRVGFEFSASHLRGVGLETFLTQLFEVAGGNRDVFTELFGSIEGLNALLALAGPTFAVFTEILEAQHIAIDAVGQGLETIAETQADKFDRAINSISVTTERLGEDILFVLVPGVQALAVILEHTGRIILYVSGALAILAAGFSGVNLVLATKTIALTAAASGIALFSTEMLTATGTLTIFERVVLGVRSGLIHLVRVLRSALLFSALGVAVLAAAAALAIWRTRAQRATAAQREFSREIGEFSDRISQYNIEGVNELESVFIARLTTLNERRKELENISASVTDSALLSSLNADAPGFNDVVGGDQAALRLVRSRERSVRAGQDLIEIENEIAISAAKLNAIYAEQERRAEIAAGNFQDLVDVTQQLTEDQLKLIDAAGQFTAELLIQADAAERLAIAELEGAEAVASVNRELEKEALLRRAAESPLADQQEEQVALIERIDEAEEQRARNRATRNQAEANAREAQRRAEEQERERLRNIESDQSVIQQLEAELAAQERINNSRIEGVDALRRYQQESKVAELQSKLSADATDEVRNSVEQLTRRLESLRQEEERIENARQNRENLENLIDQERERLRIAEIQLSAARRLGAEGVASADAFRQLQEIANQAFELGADNQTAANLVEIRKAIQEAEDEIRRLTGVDISLDVDTAGARRAFNALESEGLRALDSLGQAAGGLTQDLLAAVRAGFSLGGAINDIRDSGEGLSSIFDDVSFSDVVSVGIGTALSFGLTQLGNLFGGDNAERERLEAERQRVIDNNTQALNRLSDELQGAEFSLTELESFLSLDQSVIGTSTFTPGERPGEGITTAGLTGPIPLPLVLIAERFGIELDGSVQSMQALNQAIEIQIELAKRREAAFIQDLRVRELTAQGRDEEAEQLRLSIQHQRELDEARRLGYDQETIARLRNIQAQEKQAQQAEQAEQRARDRESFDRDLRREQLIESGASDEEIRRHDEEQRIIARRDQRIREAEDLYARGIIGAGELINYVDLITRNAATEIENLGDAASEAADALRTDIPRFINLALLEQAHGASLPAGVTIPPMENAASLPAGTTTPPMQNVPSGVAQQPQTTNNFYEGSIVVQGSDKSASELFDDFERESKRRSARSGPTTIVTRDI